MCNWVLLEHIHVFARYTVNVLFWLPLMKYKIENQSTQMCTYVNSMIVVSDHSSPTLTCVSCGRIKYIHIPLYTHACAV